MIIGNYISSLTILNNIKENKVANSKSMSKLSSGIRINKAADDAAGLGISEGMKAKIRLLKQSTRNAYDTKNMIQTMDGALGEVSSLLQRMRELSVQTLNDTLSKEDKESAQMEFRQLQLAIDNFTKDAEWNTRPLFEPHMPTYYQFEGNQKMNSAFKIVNGINNDLELSINGSVHKIYLEEGYYSINELVDNIDTKLMEINSDIIINVTENNTVTLQAENNSSIDYIKGGAAFIFYEYSIGTPPGMIIGVTEFAEDGRLNIVSGSNDKLSFWVGADKEHTINFVPKSGGYSIDELIDIINTQLESQGETEVEAIKYADKYIALASDKYVITGLSGNMIKIDGITSVLYDNVKYGTISRTQAKMDGKADLSSGLTIKKGVNDTFRFRIDQDYSLKTISLLDDEVEKTYTAQQLIDKLNNEFEENNIDAVAETYTDSYGTHLRLKSNYYGKESRIQLDTSCSAYNDLFVRVTETMLTINPYNGYETSAQINGRYGIGSSTKIVTGENDTLNFTVDGVSQSITLEGKNYTKAELVSEINSKLEAKDIKLEAGVSVGTDSNGDSYLYFKYTVPGEGNISISSASNAFKTLLCEAYVDPPVKVDGKTNITYPPEGVVAPPTITKTAATLTGKADLSSGIKIDATNNTLSFNTGKESINIVLEEGVYSSSEFLTMLSDKLEGKGITASYNNGTYLVLTTEGKGEEYKFTNIGGTAYNSILGRINHFEPYYTSTSGYKTTSYVLGRYDITNGFEVDSANKDLNFEYVHEGTTYSVNISMDERTYTGIDDIVNTLNDKIRTELSSKGLTVIDGQTADVYASKYINKNIQIYAKNSGAEYKFQNFSGGFFDDAFRRYVTVTAPYPTTVYGSSNEISQHSAYIVGREDLNKEIVINPNINDRLVFEFYKDSNKETFDIEIEAGLYSGETLVNELQSKITAQLINKGYLGDMLTVQIGGINSGTASEDNNKLVIKYNNKNDGSNDSGTYVIDGVRGSAAYTIFYKAHGEPTPTHTIGIIDLTKGVTIKTGINDTFTMDINNNEKTIVLDEGSYTAEQLLEHLNSKLSEASANVVASYYEGKLKLSLLEVGANTLDGIRGNASETLFFETSKRDSDIPKRFYVGENSSETFDLDKIRISKELMRINTIMINSEERANKALKRIDNAIKYTSSQRSHLGSVENRLDHIIKINENYEENTIASESRIRDADMAKEIMKKIKTDIIMQASQAILIQAKSASESVLSLLH